MNMQGELVQKFPLHPLKTLNKGIFNGLEGGDVIVSS